MVEFEHNSSTSIIPPLNAVNVIASQEQWVLVDSVRGFPQIYFYKMCTLDNLPRAIALKRTLKISPGVRLRVSEKSTKNVDGNICDRRWDYCAMCRRLNHRWGRQHHGWPSGHHWVCRWTLQILQCGPLSERVSAPPL